MIVIEKGSFKNGPLHKFYFRYNVHAPISPEYNKNNEFLERLTRTGPKRLHVLYEYIFVKVQCIQHECTHTRTHTHRLTHAHTHTHTPVAYQGYQGNETEEKVFKKRKDDFRIKMGNDERYFNVS